MDQHLAANSAYIFNAPKIASKDPKERSSFSQALNKNNNYEKQMALINLRKSTQFLIENG